MNAMTISTGAGREQRSAQKICGYLLPPCGMRIKCLSFAFLAFFVVISNFRFPLFQASPFPPACRAGSSRHLVRRSFSEDGSFSGGGRRITHPLRQVTRNYVKLRLTRTCASSIFPNFLDFCGTLRIFASALQSGMKRRLNLTGFTDPVQVEYIKFSWLGEIGSLGLTSRTRAG
ncbi:MAG TPA: hypothetical protein VGI03_00315 [Verrucomicrobiae bacterium]|jgi:hypothetical protein